MDKSFDYVVVFAGIFMCHGKQTFWKMVKIQY